ncbi:MAG: hypothetical protein LBV12_10880 [Puniceicoccales bacterium]|jgi:hypothetical protein|nr:hypothetical protein [Puniceicoccales bacterium]
MPIRRREILGLRLPPPAGAFLCVWPHAVNDAAGRGIRQFNRDVRPSLGNDIAADF